MANEKPPQAILPTRLKIGKFAHDVVLTDDMKVKDGRVGEYSHLRTIRIKPQQEQELEILIHELLHGIFASYNLHYQAQRLRVRPRQTEEFLVDKIAKGLAQVLKDNPDLVAYVSAKCMAGQS
jgi:hypothetical protein